VGWVSAGEWLAYTVDVASAGTYTVTFQVASVGSGGTFHLQMDGTDVTGPLTVPDTGGWLRFQTISKTVTLKAGLQMSLLVMDTAGQYAVGNFDWMEFSPQSTTPYLGTPAPVPGTIQSENFDNGGEGHAYHDTSAGNEGGMYRQTDVDIAANAD